MPAYLRPTDEIHADVLLPGDPGRAMALAQELLEQPRMSNHARGLWGYTGQTPGGQRLTIQSTGIGGPSAAAVLGELAELGVRRAVRVGTCRAIVPEVALGDLIAVSEAVAADGVSRELGIDGAIKPDAELGRALADVVVEALGAPARLASVDLHNTNHDTTALEAIAVDLTSAPLLALGRRLGIAVAAVVVVAETEGGELIEDETLAKASLRAGHAAAAALETTPAST